MGPSAHQEPALLPLSEAEDTLPKITRNPFPNLTVQVLHCHILSASVLPSNDKHLQTSVLSTAVETRG